MVGVVGSGGSVCHTVIYSLTDVEDMIKYHSENERQNTVPHSWITLSD